MLVRRCRRGARARLRSHPMRPDPPPALASCTSVLKTCASRAPTSHLSLYATFTSSPFLTASCARAGRRLGHGFRRQRRASRRRKGGAAQGGQPGRLPGAASCAAVRGAHFGCGLLVPIVSRTEPAEPVGLWVAGHVVKPGCKQTSRAVGRVDGGRTGSHRSG